MARATMERTETVTLILTGEEARVLLKQTGLYVAQLACGQSGLVDDIHRALFVALTEQSSQGKENA